MSLLEKVFGGVRNIFTEDNDELLFFILVFILLFAGEEQEGFLSSFGKSNNILIFILIFIFLFFFNENSFL